MLSASLVAPPRPWALAKSCCALNMRCVRLSRQLQRCADIYSRCQPPFDKSEGTMSLSGLISLLKLLRRAHSLIRSLENLMPQLSCHQWQLDYATYKVDSLCCQWTPRLTFWSTLHTLSDVQRTTLGWTWTSEVHRRQLVPQQFQQAPSAWNPESASVPFLALCQAPPDLALMPQVSPGPELPYALLRLHVFRAALPGASRSTPTVNSPAVCHVSGKRKQLISVSLSPDRPPMPPRQAPLAPSLRPSPCRQFLFWLPLAGFLHPASWASFSVFLPGRFCSCSSPVLPVLRWFSVVGFIPLLCPYCVRFACVALIFWLNDGAALATSVAWRLALLPSVVSRVLHPLRGIRIGEASSPGPPPPEASHCPPTLPGSWPCPPQSRWS